MSEERNTKEIIQDFIEDTEPNKNHKKGKELSQLELDYVIKKIKNIPNINLAEGVADNDLPVWLNEMYLTDKERLKPLLPPNIIPNYPDNMIADTTELCRKLPKVPIDLNEPSYTNKSDIEVSLNFKPILNEDMIDNEEILLSENITQADILVYNTICSYLHPDMNSDIRSITEVPKSKRFFTPKMIYNCFNPTSANNDHITEESEQIEQVRKSIDKMRHVYIKLNYEGFINQDKSLSKEKKQEKVKAHASAEDLLINAVKTTVTIHGHTTTGYELATIPVLYYQNLQIANQIATFKRCLLDTPKIKDKSVNNDLSVIKTQLLEHIQTIKHNPKMARKISYETFFSRCGVDISDKSVRLRKRKQLTKYLDFLVQEGEIKSYAEYKEGRKFVGIELKF